MSRIGIAQVSGPSMSPTLSDGDQVVVRYGAPVRPGHVVVLRHPLRQELLVIKRVAERRPGGSWWVVGDNPYNTTGDSTDYGAVPEELVLATAYLRFRPRARDQRTVRERLAWARSALRPLRPGTAASRMRAR